ncbi:3402_t:CDS:2, partial [Scutellospora calospora]
RPEEKNDSVGSKKEIHSITSEERKINEIKCLDWLLNLLEYKLKEKKLVKKQKNKTQEKKGYNGWSQNNESFEYYHKLLEEMPWDYESKLEWLDKNKELWCDSEIGKTSESEDLEYINEPEDLVGSELTYKGDSDKNKDLEEYFRQEKEYKELLESLTIESRREYTWLEQNGYQRQSERSYGIEKEPPNLEDIYQISLPTWGNDEFEI